MSEIEVLCASPLTLLFFFFSLSFFLADVAHWPRKGDGNHLPGTGVPSTASPFDSRLLHSLKPFTTLLGLIPCMPGINFYFQAIQYLHVNINEN